MTDITTARPPGEGRGGGISRHVLVPNPNLFKVAGSRGLCVFNKARQRAGNNSRKDCEVKQSIGIFSMPLKSNGTLAHAWGIHFIKRSHPATLQRSSNQPVFFPLDPPPSTLQSASGAMLSARASVWGSGERPWPTSPCQSWVRCGQGDTHQTTYQPLALSYQDLTSVSYKRPSERDEFHQVMLMTNRQTPISVLLLYCKQF